MPIIGITASQFQIQNAGVATIAGGYAPNERRYRIDKFDLTSTANATIFGDLTFRRDSLGAVGSATRGIFGGGDSREAPQTAFANVIDYITFSTTGNATNFGNLTVGRRYVGGGAQDSTRGIFSGGDDGAGIANVIDYVTMATTGNATDFGDLAVNRFGIANGPASSTTRGLLCGGNTGALSNVIEYVTIQTTGNSTDFGDLITAYSGLSTVASRIRCCIAGYGNTNIDYVTINTLGNALDFGDLTKSRNSMGSGSSQVRGIFCMNAPAEVTSDYITIPTLGNALSYGDTTLARYQSAGTSNSHGGL
jgi:hypothetical protein